MNNTADRTRSQMSVSEAALRALGDAVQRAAEIRRLFMLTVGAHPRHRRRHLVGRTDVRRQRATASWAADVQRVDERGQMRVSLSVQDLASKRCR